MDSTVTNTPQTNSKLNVKRGKQSITVRLALATSDLLYWDYHQ